MTEARLKEIRAAEQASHMEAYSRHELFAAGSWLAKPVKTVLELLPLLGDRNGFRGLDLGCGVGRNSIPAAQLLGGRIDCVDILPYAIERLRENAAHYGVADNITGIVSSIDDFTIEPDRYDLILAISALEHVNGVEAFSKKLEEIRAGVRETGIVCLVINSDVRERDKNSGKVLEPQFEVNLTGPELKACLVRAFAGWEVIRETVVHQKYDIPRETGTAELETDVVTYAVRKRKNAAN